MTKLKSGSGDNALHILNSLADSALVHIGFQWEKLVIALITGLIKISRMIPPKEEDEDTAVDDQEDENEEEDIDEAPGDFLDDEDDDNVIEIDLKAQGLVTESVC